jgi:gluconate 2-dehydrogenase gamma chain
MKGQRMHDHDEAQGRRPTMTRRRLLQSAGVAAATIGAGGALAACGENDQQAQVATNTDARNLPAPPPTQQPLMCVVTAFFTRSEVETVEAIAARMIPGDANDPGAREACVPAYIDRKLATFETFATPTYFKAPFAKPVPHPTGPQPGARKTILVQAKELPRYGFQGDSTPQDFYRKGLATLDKVSKQTYSARFADLPEKTQTKLLADMEDGKVGGFKEAKAFFKMVLEDVYEGMFSDPMYGGNRDLAGWKLVGYPGAQRAYTEYELMHGPQHKRVQGLRDMPAMNPGVPQPHVILPLAGTRRTKDG